MLDHLGNGSAFDPSERGPDEDIRRLGSDASAKRCHDPEHGDDAAPARVTTILPPPWATRTKTVPPVDHAEGLPPESDPFLDEIERRVSERLFSRRVAARIGRYHILEHLGSGGMGRVYTAYDEQLDRRVAVKVLRDEDLPSEVDRLRFHREARALARLSHPHVVTVYEVGRHDGRLFLAMEYVRGQSLSAWLRTKPETSLVLDAFVQAGRGLMAAHAEGLVHRDFKPHNVMRTEDGVVKVLDFGLARAPDETLDGSDDRSAMTNSGSMELPSLTVTGSIMGSPTYMSPEQHEGALIDERSDQYSFCVALWEGLTGRRPFEDSSLDELLSTKWMGPPPWPPGATDVPRVVVEAIRRGLTARANERWPSMDALLEVLSRDSGHRRRHRAAGAAAVVMMGLGAAAIGGWLHARSERCSGARAQLDGVWDPERRDEAETAVLATGRPHATGVWARTEGALDEYAEGWTTMHTSTCEATVVRQEQSRAMLDLRMACLHRASVELGAVVDSLTHADAKVVDKAHALVAGLPPLSRCEDTKALEDHVEPPLPEDAALVEQGRSLLARARSQRRTGHYDEGLRSAEEAREMLATVGYGPIRVELAFARGKVLGQLGRYDAAVASLDEALELGLQWSMRDQSLEAAIELMIVVGQRQLRFEEALRYWPVARGLSRHDPQQATSVQSAHAGILLAQGKLDRAEAELRATLESTQMAFGPDHIKVAAARNNLGAVLFQQGRFREAQAEFRAALASKEELLGAEHPETILSRLNVGSVLHGRGKLAEAETEYRAILEPWSKVLGPDHPEIAALRNNLAAALDAQGKTEEAEAQYRQSLASMVETQGPGHPRVAAIRDNLAQFLADRGRHEEAEAEFRVALAMRRDALDSDHPDVASSRHNVGVILHTRGKLGEAETELRAALASREETLGPDHPDVAESRRALASLLLERGQEPEALPLAEDALRGLRRDDAPAPEYAETELVLAKLLWSVKGPRRDRARARSLAEDAAKWYRKAEGDHTAALEDVGQWLSSHPLH